MRDTDLDPFEDIADEWIDEQTRTKRVKRSDGGMGFFHGQLQGGRWAIWLGRAGLWGLVAVLLLLGALTLLRPRPAPRPAQQAAPSPTFEQTFPADAAKAFAARFTSVYLEWNPPDPSVRAERLAPFIPEGADQQFGWAGNGAERAVAILPVQMEILSPNAAVVTVSVEVSGFDAPRWLHFAVPVYTDGQGRFVITAPPALVPEPGEAVPPPEPLMSIDTQLTQELREPLTGFFRAYAGTEPAQLEYLLAPGTQMGTLGGTVALEDLALTVPQGGDTRAVVARVRWADQVTESSYTLTYEVTVTKGEDGRWYVQRVSAHVPAAQKTG